MVYMNSFSMMDGVDSMMLVTKCVNFVVWLVLLYLVR